VAAAKLVSGLVRPHPGPFAASIAGSVVYAAGTVATTIVLGRMIDDVVIPVLDGSAEPVASTVVGWSVLIVAISVLRVMGVTARRYFAGMTAERVALQYRSQLAESYVRLPMSFHKRRKAGDLLAHVDSDSEKIAEVLNPLPFSVAVVMMVIFAGISIVIVDPLLAVVAFTVFPVLVFINRIYTDRVEGPATAQQHAVGQVGAVAHESFDGSLVVKLLGREADEVARFDAEAQTLLRHRVKVGNIRAVFEAVLDMTPNLGIALILIVGAWRVDAGAVTIGGLIQVAAMFAALSFPIRTLGFFLESVPPSTVSKNRLETVSSEPIPLPGQNFKLPDGPLDLVIRDLTVGYGDQIILSGVDMDVRAGEVVAIVGATGSGKSTMISTIVGLLDPDEGSIEFGGLAVADIEPTARANAIRVAFQEAFLFADSVEDNVALDRPGVSVDDVVSAVRTAEATEFVDDLPAGTGTIVGERGLTLSGGQRQRLALARAFAGSPRLVILDDATSAVDPVIERQILDRLRTMTSAPSMLVVAHRLSTIRLADRVVFVNEGRIAGRGSHEELLAIPAYLALVTAYQKAEAQQ